jgi:hypothetical protein
MTPLSLLKKHFSLIISSLFLDASEETEKDGVLTGCVLSAENSAYAEACC